jgi:hypothetical protein
MCVTFEPVPAPEHFCELEAHAMLMSVWQVAQLLPECAPLFVNGTPLATERAILRFYGCDLINHRI